VQQSEVLLWFIADNTVLHSVVTMLTLFIQLSFLSYLFFYLCATDCVSVNKDYHRSHLNQKHTKNANRLQEFVHKRCSKCPPFARTHAWRCFLHWSTAKSIMTCQKSDRTAIKLSFSTLRTLNERKAKCWYFAWC